MRRCTRSAQTAGPIAERANQELVCTITGVGRALGGLCSGVLTLRDGQIAGQFAWGHSGSSHLQAVVGGTGRYAGARGQFVVDTNGTDEREDFTVVLYGTR